MTTTISGSTGINQTSFTATTLNSSSGAINATIGATTPNTGVFTTLSASGLVSLPSAVSSNSTIAGEWDGSGAAGRIRIQTTNTAGTLTARLLLREALVQITPSGTSVADFTSTGLAVTGALSATNPLTVRPATNTAQLVLQQDNTAGSYSTIWRDSSNGALKFGIDTGATYATLDAAGNLGLGVTPSAWASYQKAIDFGGDGNYGALSARATLVELGNNCYYNDVGTSSDKYKISSQEASKYSLQGAVHKWYTAPSGTAGNPITFTQAMTLDASGNHIVGAASTSDAISNGGYFYAASGRYTFVSHPSGTASGDAYSQFYYGGGSIGSITQNGTTAVAYNTTSDHRLKENVRPADAARFMDIQFRDFEWVDGRHDCGVIAHELQAVYPDLVLGEKDATEVRDGETAPVYQQVNYIGLIGRMGTVIQQQQRALAALEARLAAAGIA